MIKVYLVIYFAVFLMDIINVISLRDLVYSFLLSKRNLKGAKKIHNAQTKMMRFTLKYIENYTIYPKEFRFFQKSWIIYLASILPQWAFAILIHLLNFFNPLIFVAVISSIKIVCAVIIRSQFKSRISRFDKRY